jgi:hypothetical protein
VEQRTRVGSATFTHASHFSASKGHCFMVVFAIAHVVKNTATDAFDSDMRRLIDLSSGRQIGRLVILSTQSAPLFCQVRDLKCANVNGWNDLIGPYMRD